MEIGHQRANWVTAHEYNYESAGWQCGSVTNLHINLRIKQSSGKLSMSFNMFPIPLCFFYVHKCFHTCVCVCYVCVCVCVCVCAHKQTLRVCD